MEQSFIGNVHLMASRDNDLKHKLDREYFDRPFLTTRGSGTGFTPLISRPHLMINPLMTARNRSREKYNSFVNLERSSMQLSE